MKRLLVVAVLVGVVASATPLLAVTRDLGVPRRERRQQHRIVQGERSGRLTHREARSLGRGQVRIHRTERRTTSHGKLTRMQRGRLHRMQNRRSHRISRVKHNRRHV